MQLQLLPLILQVNVYGGGWGALVFPGNYFCGCFPFYFFFQLQILVLYAYKHFFTNVLSQHFDPGGINLIYFDVYVVLIIAIGVNCSAFSGVVFKAIAYPRQCLSKFLALFPGER